MATPDTGIDWPAWVQAVGTVAALFLTGGLAWWETRQRRREESRRMADQLLARVAILSFAGEQIETFIRTQRSDERTHMVTAIGYYKSVAHFLQQAESVAVTEMPTKACVDQYFIIQACFSNIARLMSVLEPSWLAESEIERLQKVSAPIGPAIKSLHRLAEAYKVGRIQ